MRLDEISEEIQDAIATLLDPAMGQQELAIWGDDGVPFGKRSSIIFEKIPREIGSIENAVLLSERYPILALYPPEDLAGILGSGLAAGWSTSEPHELLVGHLIFANPIAGEIYEHKQRKSASPARGEIKIHLAMHRIFWLFNPAASQAVGQLGAMTSTRRALVIDSFLRMGFFARLKFAAGDENPQLADAYATAFEEVFGQGDLNWGRVQDNQRGRWTGEGWGKMGAHQWSNEPLLFDRTFDDSPEALQQVVDTVRFLHRFQELAGLIPFTSMFDKVF